MPKRVRDASRAVAPRAEDGDTKLSAYAKLLSHCGRIKPADRPSPAELAGAEEDADETVAPKASHTLGESASAEGRRSDCREGRGGTSTESSVARRLTI